LSRDERTSDYHATKRNIIDTTVVSLDTVLLTLSIARVLVTPFRSNCTISVYPLRAAEISGVWPD
jgi:hypothetical protein